MRRERINGCRWIAKSMPNFELSAHTKDMLKERGIAEEWVWRTLNTPDRKRRGDDGNMHYIKTIRERDGRVLRVVVNADVQPNLVVTVFFDRRLGQRVDKIK
jgi:hypothetical protein